MHINVSSSGYKWNPFPEKLNIVKFMVHVLVSSLEKKIKFKCSHMPIELSVKIYVSKQIRWNFDHKINPIDSELFFLARNQKFLSCRHLFYLFPSGEVTVFFTTYISKNLIKISILALRPWYLNDKMIIKSQKSNSKMKVWWGDFHWFSQGGCWGVYLCTWVYKHPFTMDVSKWNAEANVFC